MILLSILIKKNHPQVYLECKYRVKKTQMPKFIKNELKSDSESESDLDSDDKELMAKLIKIWYWFWLWFRFRFRSWVKI